MARRDVHLPDSPLFVVLDGVDGCGKTTQAARLLRAIADLRGAGVPAPLHLREPGSTPGGERIRELVLAPDVELGRGTLALLFAAARREMLERLVAPAIASGSDVVVERFHASTFAYQGGRQVGEADSPSGFTDDELLQLLRTWAGAPVPTIEIILDLEPEVAFERARARAGGASDRFEARGVEFQRRVAAGMRDYVERVPTALRVDADGDEDVVAGRVIDAVLARTGERARV